MAQINQYQAYHDRMTDRVIEFLQTRDTTLFPFSTGFDEARMTAFVHDLRDALSSLTDSGSARKTSAAGFVVSDQRIRDVIDEWARAGGDWPDGTNANNPDTALGTVRR